MCKNESNFNDRFHSAPTLQTFFPTYSPVGCIVHLVVIACQFITNVARKPQQLVSDLRLLYDDGHCEWHEDRSEQIEILDFRFQLLN